MEFVFKVFYFLYRNIAEIAIDGCINTATDAQRPLNTVAALTFHKPVDLFAGLRI